MIRMYLTQRHIYTHSPLLLPHPQRQNYCHFGKSGKAQGQNPRIRRQGHLLTTADSRLPQRGLEEITVMTAVVLGWRDLSVVEGE